MVPAHPLHKIPPCFYKTSCNPRGRAFYFRARWGLWRLDVAHPGYGQDELFDHCDTVAQGEHPEAGWWEEDEARAALENALRIFYKTGAKK